MNLFNLFKKKQPYDTTKELVYRYELRLLRRAAFCKGEREEALKELRKFTAWRLNEKK